MEARDQSATPYYLTGSGYIPGTLFPWVVSDFGLIEAIGLSEVDKEFSGALLQCSERLKSDLPLSQEDCDLLKAIAAGELEM